MSTRKSFKQQKNKHLIRFYGTYEVAFCLQKTRPFYNYIYNYILLSIISIVVLHKKTVHILFKINIRLVTEN